MKEISCIIIDDDPIFVNKLLKQIDLLPFIRVIGTCHNYGEALALTKSEPADFIILDINLEDECGLNGFDFLRHNSKLPPVVIVSNSPEYAVESYAIGKAKDFLVKPFDKDRLLLAINRAIVVDIKRNQMLGSNSMFFKIGRRFQRFELDEIDYFEGYGIYTKVWVQGNQSIINDSLAELELSLKNKNFMRVHKSYIINLNKLVGFDNSKLYLKNGSVPIGASYKEKLSPLLCLFDDSNFEK